MEADPQLIGQGRGKPEEHGVDHQPKEAEGQQHQRAGEQVEQGPQQGVKQPEDQGDHADLPARPRELDPRHHPDGREDRQ